LLDGTDLAELCRQRQWVRTRLVFELRAVAWSKQRRKLPDDASMIRQLREWIHGRRGLGAQNAELLAEIFHAPFAVGKPQEPQALNPDVNAEFAERLAKAKKLDRTMILGFEERTEELRVLDRQLGASKLLKENESHVERMNGLRRHALHGDQRPSLAAAIAEAAALAGWQALDLGDAGKAWDLHETAKEAAKESNSSAVLAHVTAQQAFALLDTNHPKDAAELIRFARQEADGKIPDLLRSWLFAAEAEALAASNDPTGTQGLLDSAAASLPPDGAPDDELPFLFLNDAHLGRWRGHCLARLGMDEAVQELSAAVKGLDPTFTRAAAGLHCDLALAHSVRGHHEEARTEAKAAERLATQTASARQRRRINRLLVSGEERSAH
jgi:hypothetical protein